MTSLPGNAFRVVRGSPVRHRDTYRGTVNNVGLVAVLGLGVAILSAQQQQPTFRTATRLVEITVSVLDKKGNAVAGLGPADFLVLDEGKERPVALFQSDGVRGASADRPETTLPAGEFTNRPAATDTTPRSVTAIVFDNINTTPLQGVKARAQAMRYLLTLAPHTVTAIYLVADHLYVLHDFTDDAAALRARLEKVRLPTPAAREMSDREAAEAFNSFAVQDPSIILFAQFVLSRRWFMGRFKPVLNLPHTAGH